ncbi:KAT8 regulatory NSL complex subunit 3 isoform X1 [Drosophila willistoni]|uniref:KAT8 regulatory NSL complex subunit 3 isoform X1 n=1 Tax=Drosophila willistoni TaxID=7260 RepID=UPI000C26D98F|nr:KAT8 regulatory NSL complex subunit 3 isoform X1 [Drosophila willistoni]
MSSFFECFNNFVQSGGNVEQNVSQDQEQQQQQQQQMQIIVGAETAVEMRRTTTPTPSESSSTISAHSETSLVDKMEHSYMRDPPARSTTSNSITETSASSGLSLARTILVHHPPQCPSCHTYPSHQDQDLMGEQQQAHVPPYDEIAAKEAMNECTRIAKYVKNNNPDEQDWQERINQIGWTPAQTKLFQQVANILDQDQLARLANDKRQHEPVYRRITVDKSSSRMRRVLAGVFWESRIIQWLHALLMDHLSPSYMASYLDILQTLKTKLPTLMDKMLFGRPLSNCQELLAPVMKKRWEPHVLPKSRQIYHNAIMVVIPTMPTNGTVPERMQKWYQSLATITQISTINLPNTNNRMANQNLDQVAETIVSLTRVRIHELRSENPSRGIILIGFNAGAALALQVALSESVACVICMGFAYNTLRGPRGAPDDRMLDIKAPILFVIGQNSARTSQEEMEGLRERMQSESSLVVVGSADDSLKVPKSKRRIEGVTQSMVDSMVVDEIYEFVNRTLSNPPGPRMPSSLLPYQQRQPKQAQGHLMVDKTISNQVGRKRKGEVGQDDSRPMIKTRIVQAKPRIPRASKPKPPRLIDPFAAKRKVGRPRTRPLPQAMNNQEAPKPPHSPAPLLTNDELNQSIESILDETLDYDDPQPTTMSSASQQIVTKVVTPTGPKPLGPQPVNLAAGTKIKMIPSNQFVHLKMPGSQGKLINYTINKSGTAVPTIGSVVKTSSPSAGGAAGGSQQFITLKAPLNQSPGAGGGGQIVSGSQKYTVYKNLNGMTMLQVAKSPAPTVASPDAAQQGGSRQMDLSNIIDMPIVFADNEGNIADQAEKQQTTRPAPSKGSPLIISQKIIKEGTHPPPGKSPLLINKGGLQQLFTTTTSSPGGVATGSSTSSPATATSKVVYLNRSTIKPMGNAGARLPIRIVSSATGSPKTTVTSAAATSSTTPLILDGKTVNLQTITKNAGGTLRQSLPIIIGNKSYPQVQVINPAGSASVTSTPTGKHVYLKSATGLKQVPVQMLSNRVTTSGGVNMIPSSTPGGAAVRRVVNISALPKDGKVIKLLTTATKPGSMTPDPHKG